MRILLVCSLLLALSVNVLAQNYPSRDNAELAQMYKEDQADRTAGTRIDWSKVAERDRQREERVREMLDEGLVMTSNDYANAAMIFQHGNDTVASAMAVKMMRTAVKLDPTRSKWLLAAAIDRDLMYRNKPQIYGTQYRRSGEGEWVLYTIDKDAVTDEERQEYNVPTLAQTYARLELMNSKQLMELYKSGKSVEEVVAFVRDNYDKDSGYDLTENGVNNFGYELMGEGHD
ncbi:MAG: tetratricopeptide repeat protein, partial [Owenweeksia sp.]